ncbi:MAG: hypothetical protein D6763_08225 [Alphaproteobacteria bacterium]|nr:MAG: hypothetical protein D6763_08225 [Alphaproteobacteria bacterium]
MNSLIVQLNHKQTFHIPEGTYLAELDSVHTKQRQGIPYVRFVFRIFIPGLDPSVHAKAASEMPLQYGPESFLFKYLHWWFGEEELRSFGNQLDLQSLKGRKADVVLTHFKQEGYSQPYVNVNKVGPPGSMSGKTEEHEIADWLKEHNPKPEVDPFEQCNRTPKIVPLNAIGNHDQDQVAEAAFG